MERLGPCVLPRSVSLNVGFRRSVRDFPDFDCLVCALLRFFFEGCIFSHFLFAPSCYLLESSACEEFAGLSSMLPLSESSAVGNLGELRLGTVAAPVCRKFSSLGLGAKWAAASTTLACFDHRTCGNTLQWWMLCWGPWISTACFAYLHRVALFQKMPQYHPLHYMSQDVVTAHVTTTYPASALQTNQWKVAADSDLRHLFPLELSEYTSTSEATYHRRDQFLYYLGGASFDKTCH